MLLLAIIIIVLVSQDFYFLPNLRIRWLPPIVEILMSFQNYLYANNKSHKCPNVFGKLRVQNRLLKIYSVVFSSRKVPFLYGNVENNHKKNYFFMLFMSFRQSFLSLLTHILTSVEIGIKISFLCLKYR